MITLDQPVRAGDLGEAVSSRDAVKRIRVTADPHDDAMLGRSRPWKDEAILGRDQTGQGEAEEELLIVVEATGFEKEGDLGLAADLDRVVLAPGVLHFDVESDFRLVFVHGLDLQLVHVTLICELEEFPRHDTPLPF